MTTINFPSAPLVNQLYTYNNKTWQYNGVGWAAQSASVTANSVVAVASTAPSSPVLGQEWEDLVSGAKFTWMGSQWVELGSAGGGSVGATGATGPQGPSGSPVKISSIAVALSNGTLLDDTAVDLAGGYIKIFGSGFVVGCTVVVGGVLANSTAFVSSTELLVQISGQTAGTYIVYVTNPDGSTAVRVNAVTFSALPNWTTSSALQDSLINNAISLQLVATDAVTFALAVGSVLPTGLTLSSTGLLSGTVTGLSVATTYNFVVVATDAQLQDSPRTFQITITVGDPYFKNTVLLLNGERSGTTAVDNKVFLDSSTANAGSGWTITPTGTPTQGSFSPFSQTGWSGYFAATTDRLAAPASVGNVGAAFCIEFWINPSASSGSVIVGPTGSGAIQIGYQSTTSFGFCATGVAWRLTTATVPTLNAWNHFVFVRSGTGTGQSSLFMNGSRVANGQVSDALTTANIPYFGSAPDNSSNITAYVSNMRFVTGATLPYDPAATTITVPTAPLTAITGTSLLTLQDNRFKDNSANNFTLTPSGTPSIQAFSPFAPTIPYSAAVVGGSGYWGVKTDSLNITSVASITTFTGDFTLETWVFPTDPTISTTWGILDSRTAAASATSWVFAMDSYTAAGWLPIFYTGTYFRATLRVPLSQWSHIALTRVGTTLRFYINGVLDTTTATLSGTITGGTSTVMVGMKDNANANTGTVGYLNGTRITNGSAVYTGTFTPPTAPLATSGSASASAYPSTTNVNTVFPATQCSLLLNFTNGGVVDATAKNDLITVGTAQISTSVKQFGSGSIYCNGSGNYVAIPSSVSTTLGTGDFTAELWVNPINWTQTSASLISGEAGSLHIGRYNATSFIGITASGQGWIITDVALPSTATWTHVAVVRSSGNLFAFINGTRSGTLVSGNTTSFTAITTVGADSAGTYPFTGYLDDVRVTKGYCRYAVGTGANANQMVFTGTNNLALPTQTFLVQ